MNIFACLEPACDAPATAETPIIMGYDHDNKPFWACKVTCVKGHRYIMEALTVQAMETFEEIEVLERRLGLAGS